MRIRSVNSESFSYKNAFRWFDACRNSELVPVRRVQWLAPRLGSRVQDPFVIHLRKMGIGSKAR